MLQEVSSEIGIHLKYFTDFSNFEAKVERWDKLIMQSNYEIVLTQTQSGELVDLLLQIQDIVKFF